MKPAICHYSLHRRYKAENWTPLRLAQEVKSLGLEAVDFHAGLLGDPDTAVERVTQALEQTGLTLSGFSLSTNFNQESPRDFQRQLDAAWQWMQVAARLKAPVSRIFGGSLPEANRGDESYRHAAWGRMIDGVAAAARQAEKLGLMLGLENHGGLPCTADEQVRAIRNVNSPSLRATIDVGNYMSGGEEGHQATATVAPYAVYVHFKDNKKMPDASKPWGWNFQSCALGEGDVDLAACLEALRRGGYDGYVALEYEGVEDESAGVPKCIALMKKLLK
jgi:sugar phosphate isomerase/epimerase